MLTGAAAVEALTIYSRLGASGASFDSRKVAVAVRTKAGRVRLRVALMTGRVRASLVASKPRRAPRDRRGTFGRLLRSQSVSGGLSPPGRPGRPAGAGG